MSKKLKKEKQVVSGLSNEKLCSILGYIIIGLIWYLADEKIRTPNTKFHVKQGLVLLIAEIINGAIWSIPLFGQFVGSVINLGLLILMIIGIINVMNDRQQKLPLLGKFAENFKF